MDRTACHQYITHARALQALFADFLQKFSIFLQIDVPRETETTEVGMFHVKHKPIANRMFHVKQTKKERVSTPDLILLSIIAAFFA